MSIDQAAATPSAPHGVDGCPCGAGAPVAACCGRYLAGARAPTALALMRSRYTAYVRGDIDYLVATHREATRAQLDVPAMRRWSRDTVWQGLEIIATARGGESDEDGVVEFIARGVTRGTPFAQRERSTFRNVDGAWYYEGGKAHAEPDRRAAVPGRNDPCPCGSGKKYKRCHA